MLYEDQLVKVSLAPNAAVHGHILVQMQQTHLADLDEEQASHLFLVASYCAAILFQGLKAQGTNIILEESPVRVHIIARKDNDGINFQWDPKQIDPAIMDDACDRVSDKIGTTLDNASQNQEPTAPTQTVNQEIYDEEERENYLIKQLIRIP